MKGCHRFSVEPQSEESQPTTRKSQLAHLVVKRKKGPASKGFRAAAFLPALVMQHDEQSHSGAPFFFRACRLKTHIELSLQVPQPSLEVIAVGRAYAAEV